MQRPSEPDESSFENQLPLPNHSFPERLDSASIIQAYTNVTVLESTLETLENTDDIISTPHIFLVHCKGGLVQAKPSLSLQVKHKLLAH